MIKKKPAKNCSDIELSFRLQKETKMLKKIAIGFGVLVVLAAIFGESEDGGSNTTKSSEPEKQYFIGEQVVTDYFNFTVEGVDTPASLGAYSDPAGTGNMFVRIKVLAENTDNEARSFSSGTLYGFMNEKEFMFDTSEFVMSDGYHAFDSLNPLVSKSGWVVFKVSDKFDVSQMQYELPRSDIRVNLKSK